VNPWVELQRAPTGTAGMSCGSSATRTTCATRYQDSVLTFIPEHGYLAGPDAYYLPAHGLIRVPEQTVTTLQMQAPFISSAHRRRRTATMSL
jgi:hypothetical protein